MERTGRVMEKRGRCAQSEAGRALTGTKLPCASALLHAPALPPCEVGRQETLESGAFRFSVRSLGRYLPGCLHSLIYSHITGYRMVLLCGLNRITHARHPVGTRWAVGTLVVKSRAESPRGERRAHLHLARWAKGGQGEEAGGAGRMRVWGPDTSKAMSVLSYSKLKAILVTFHSFPF